MYVTDRQLSRYLTQVTQDVINKELCVSIAPEQVLNMLEELQQWRERYMDQEMQRYAEIEAAE